MTVAALVLATLTEHLPSSADDAAELIADRYAERLQTGRLTGTERNVRLPETLRLRLDELVRAAKARVSVASRSALVDAILARHLPSDPDDASQLVVRGLIALIDTGPSHAGEPAAARCDPVQRPRLTRSRRYQQ